MMTFESYLFFNQVLGSELDDPPILYSSIRTWLYFGEGTQYCGRGGGMVTVGVVTMNQHSRKPYSLIAVEGRWIMAVDG